MSGLRRYYIYFVTALTLSSNFISLLYKALGRVLKRGVSGLRRYYFSFSDNCSSCFTVFSNQSKFFYFNI